MSTRPIPTALHLVIEPNAVVPVSTVFSVRGLTLDNEINHPIHLIIGRGNVFHPGCHIVLDTSHLSNPISSTLEFRIGDNNVWEECSTVVFILRESNNQLMGSYNQISSRCHLETSRVGNGNIFQPCCQIQIPTIQNGNIFSPLCIVSIKDTQNIHEMVFYVIQRNGDVSPSCYFREHQYGTRKNIAQVGLLLNVVKKIVEANHPILAITM
jgi:hypothetical protein